MRKKMIKTERLFLREMTEQDFDALYAVLSDSDIMRHYPYTFDEKRVPGRTNENMERYNIFGFVRWAVCLKEGGEMIGNCGLTIRSLTDRYAPRSAAIFERTGKERDMPRKPPRQFAIGLLKTRPFAFFILT